MSSFYFNFVIKISKMFLVLILPIFVLTTHPTDGRRSVPNDLKHERVNDKFVLTSTRYEGGMDSFSSQSETGCLKIDIHVPDSFDPLPICLKLRATSKNSDGFHKNFKLVNTKKVSTLDDILAKNKGVEGFVVGIGLSFISGYFRNDEFYGTLVFSHSVRNQNIICSILPLSLLPEFTDLSKMDEEEKQEYIFSKTVYGYKKIRPNAIVTCGDMHRSNDDDIQHPFSFTGHFNPRNIKLKKVVARQRRQAEPPAPNQQPANSDPTDPDPIAAAPPHGSPAPAPAAPAPPTAATAAVPPPPAAAVTPIPVAVGGPSLPRQSETDSSKTETQSKKSATKALTKFMKHDKHGTYYVAVCYIVDASYLARRFNGSAEEATLLLSGYVELSDWILRATDWNNDGVPDNLGVRLLEVRIDFMTRELKAPDQKWGRSNGGSFLKRYEAFKIIREIGKRMNPDCDVRSGIGEINVSKYVLHEAGGCTACKNQYLTSFVNPYVEKFSPRGEQIRLLYHQIRILTFAMVYTKSYCANCTGKLGGETKQSAIAQTFENSDPDWGACIVEGDLQSRSNIPLNSFRLSACSKKDGMACLNDLGARNSCMKFEPEDSYCGNGIIEGDEECDCGTLATCAEQSCLCSPRSGRNPCRKLSLEESKVCFSLIRCRGFRFLHELGRANSSAFMAAFNTFVDGTHYKMGQNRHMERPRTSESTQKDTSKFLYFFLHLIIFCLWKHLKA